MNRLVAAVTLGAAILAAACSANQATSNVGTLDGAALQACRDVHDVIAARVAGPIEATDLRARLGKIYQEASASANPIIKAKAVAIFADATEIASGGEGRSLSSDLTAMLQSCSGV